MRFPSQAPPTARRRSRVGAFVLLPLVALTALSGCGDDPTEPEEPEIGTVRLIIGAQTVNVTGSGTPTVTLSGASTNVAATFLAVDGSVLTLDTAEFEVRLTPANAGVVTFNRLTAFSGTLNRVTAGITTIAVEVFHKVEGHSDFGPFNVSVTVQ